MMRFSLELAGETGGLSFPLMAAADRLFHGGGGTTATILCVYRNNTTATGVAGACA